MSVNSKRWSTITSTTSTTISTAAVAAINRCSLQTFEQCLSMMQEVMDNSSLAFPVNAQYLDITCRKLKSGDYCAEKYIRSCAGNRQRHLYQDIVQGSKNVIRLLCQQGQTQQLYLKYAPCYKDISVSETKCSPVINRFQAISKLMGAEPGEPPLSGFQESQSSTDRLRQFCCAYRDSVDCQLRYTRQHCGQEGLRFFERYMSEMTNSVINEHCIGYTYSDKCRRQHPPPHQQQYPDGQFIYFNNSTDQSQPPPTPILPLDNSAASRPWIGALLVVAIALL